MRDTALAGMSLSDYLVRALEALAQRLSQEELLGHEAVVSRIWQLRENLGAHDAAYVSLAEGLRCPLPTTDAKLARAPGHGAEIVMP